LDDIGIVYGKIILKLILSRVCVTTDGDVLTAYTLTTRDYTLQITEID
jgi:hypothetical protein